MKIYYNIRYIELNRLVLNENSADVNAIFRIPHLSYRQLVFHGSVLSPRMKALMQIFKMFACDMGIYLGR